MSKQRRQEKRTPLESGKELPLFSGEWQRNSRARICRPEGTERRGCSVPRCRWLLADYYTWRNFNGVVLWCESTPFCSSSEFREIP